MRSSRLSSVGLMAMAALAFSGPAVAAAVADAGTRSMPADRQALPPGLNAEKREDWLKLRRTDRRGYSRNTGWTDRRYRRAAAKKRDQLKARRAAR